VVVPMLMRRALLNQCTYFFAYCSTNTLLENSTSLILYVSLILPSKYLSPRYSQSQNGALLLFSATGNPQYGLPIRAFPHHRRSSTNTQHRATSMDFFAPKPLLRIPTTRPLSLTN
jgi:hypothetical protein